MKHTILIASICYSILVIAQTTPVENIKISGKITNVFGLTPPCEYVYLEVLTNNGKKIDIYINDLNKLKVDNQKFFKWSEEKIYNLLEESITEAEIKIPKDVYNIDLINKVYIFYCYKQILNCGDDSTVPKDYFVNKISVK